MSESIEQQFRAAAKLDPARDADSDGHTTLTYGEVLAAADRGIHGLSRAGLKDGEPVVVPVSNMAADIAAFLAVWRAGEGGPAPPRRAKSRGQCPDHPARQPVRHGPGGHYHIT